MLFATVIRVKEKIMDVKGGEFAYRTSFYGKLKQLNTDIYTFLQKTNYAIEPKFRRSSSVEVQCHDCHNIDGVEVRSSSVAKDLTKL